MQEANSIEQQQPKTSDTQAIPLLICPKCEIEFPYIFLEPSPNQMNIVVKCCGKDANEGNYVISLTQLLTDLHKKRECYYHKDKEAVKFYCSNWICRECAKYDKEYYDTSVRFSCLYHYKKPFIYYCKRCKSNECDTCYDKDHLDHDVIPFPEIKYVEPNPNFFGEFKAKTRKLTEEFIAKLSLDDDKHKQMKVDILSVCETNEAINDQLQQLSQIFFRTKEFSKTYPTKVMTTLADLIINNVEYKHKERTIEKEFASLKKYLQKNYVLKQIKTGRIVKKLTQHSGRVLDLIQLKDKRIVSCSLDKTIKFWNPDTYECIGVLKGHTKGVNGILQLKDGRLASCSEDCTTKIWDLNTNECVATSEQRCTDIHKIFQLTDGRICCCSIYNDIEIWDLDTLKQVETLKGHKSSCNQVIQLFDGRLGSCSNDRTAKIWDVSSYKCLGTLKGRHDDSVNCIIQLKDTRLAIGSKDESVSIWDSITFKCLKIIIGTSSINCLLEMTDGRLILGEDPNSLATYDLTTYKLLDIKERCDGGITTRVYQLKNGYVAACSTQGYFTIWDL